LGVLWVMSYMGKVFHHFGSGYLALGPIARWDLFAQNLSLLSIWLVF